MARGGFVSREYYLGIVIILSYNVQLSAVLFPFSAALAVLLVQLLAVLLGRVLLKLFSAAINFYWAARAIGCGLLPGRLATVASCWRVVAELFHNDTELCRLSGKLIPVQKTRNGLPDRQHQLGGWTVG